MSTITVDTLKYTKRFEAAGLNRIQAEELAEAFQESRADILSEVRGRDDSLATKGDIRELELRMMIFRKDIILWLGGIMIVGFAGIATVLLKYLPLVARLVEMGGK